MDFKFTEEQEMLRESARDFLERECPKTLVREIESSEKGYSSEIWQQMAELGWLGLVFPEKYSGSGMSFLDLAVLLEEMGRSYLPVPFFSTVVLSGLPILDTGTEEQKQKYLPQIASGKAISTLALTEPSAKYDAASIAVKARVSNSDYIISGTKLFVSDAHIADYLLCVVRTSEQAKPEDGITIFLVDTKIPDISYTVLKTSANDKLCEVVFDQCKVPKESILGELDQGWSTVQTVIERAAVAKCCEMVGSAQRMLEMTIHYAKERKQFGKLIGSAQVIQESCADMLIDLDASRLITYEAAWRLSQGLPCVIEVSMAKAYVSAAYRRIALKAHEICGGVALMIVHDMPFFSTRVGAEVSTFGDSDFHRDIVAKELGL